MTAISAAQAPARERPLNRMRRTIARRMRASVVDKPHVTLNTVADAARLRQACANEQVSPTAVVLAAVGAVLPRHEELNAWLVEDKLVLPGRVDVGVAVDVPGGLMVPVVRGVDRLSLHGIHEALRDMATRARAGDLTGADVMDATFSVSTLGSFGITHFTPIISPPQVALLGIGAITQAPVVRDGGLAVGHQLCLSLSFDHAALDGAPAARFLKDLVAELEGAPDPVRSGHEGKTR